LRDYKSGARPGYEPTNGNVVQPMKDEDFVELAYYLAKSGNKLHDLAPSHFRSRAACVGLTLSRLRQS